MKTKKIIKLSGGLWPYVTGEKEFPRPHMLCDLYQIEARMRNRIKKRKL